MILCLESNEYVWYELSTVDEVLKLGKYQSHCLAERCHYHDDFEEGNIRLFGCYKDDIPVMFAATLDFALIEMCGKYGHPPPQKYITPAIAFIRSEYVMDVWDVDGNLHEAGIVKVNGEWVHVRSLPTELVVGHSLNLNNISTCHELPKGLTVCGDLKINKTQINELPEDLIVHGEIDQRY